MRCHHYDGPFLQILSYSFISNQYIKTYCVASVLDVNELMTKKTVLKLEVENINLKVFTILTEGSNHTDFIQ